MSPDNSFASLGQDRDGFVLGEGAGVMVLKSMSMPRPRGLDLALNLSGYGMSADAGHMTAPEHGRSLTVPC